MIKNEGLGTDNQKVYDLNAIGLGAEPVEEESSTEWSIQSTKDEENKYGTYTEISIRRALNPSRSNNYTLLLETPQPMAYAYRTRVAD